MVNDVEQKDNNIEIQEEAGLSVVNGQIIFREGESNKVVSNAMRKKLSVDGLSDDAGQKGFSLFERYDLNVDASEEDILNKIEENMSEENLYSNFVDSFVESRGLNSDVRDQMLGDSELKEKFLYRLKAHKTDYKTESDVREALDEMNRVFSKYASVTNVEVGTAILIKRNELKLNTIDKRLIKSGNFRTKSQVELYKRWKKGGISNRQYHDEVNKIYSDAIKESGDEELQAMWEEEQEFDLFADYVKKEKEAQIYSDLAPLDNKDVKKVNAEVRDSTESDNFEIKFNNGGVANVETSYCSLVIRAKKDVRTNKYIYFVEDNYSNDGSYGPIDNPEKLQFIIDGRQIDAFLTDSIANPNQQAEFDGLSDDLVMDVALKLIGKANTARNFSLREMDRGLLSKLIGFLTELEIEDLNTMEDKLKKIKNFMSDDGGIETVQRLFKKGDWNGIKDELS